MIDVLCIYPGPAAFRQKQVAAHRPLLESLGVRLLLADDYDDPGDRACFADVIALPPPEELAAGKRALDRALSGRAIHGVLAQSESGLCLGALVAAERGLPCIPLQAALLTTSKFGTRTALESARVPQPRFALARTAADVRRFASTHDFPVVLKASASALARLVTLVRSEAEIDEAVARIRAGLALSPDVRRLCEFGRVAGLDLGHDPLDQFLVESYARGLPVETDGVVSRDRIGTFGVTEQILTPPPLFFFEGYLTPADLPERDIAAIEATSDAALRALGVRDTGFSIEMRWDAARASILEVNGRLGWDEGFGDLFAAITGMQPVLQTLQIALGQTVVVERRPDVRAAVAYSACYADRIVLSTPSAETIAEVEREFDVQAGTCVWPGDRTVAPPDPDATPHLAWALARDPESSRSAYDAARRALTRLPVELGPVP
ncbi:MAG: ATP-grasp domain-containing protein [Planctomycetota bacterium]|nr:ATP-grasp domain-containing protein [Planctomycetota bacterium]